MNVMGAMRTLYKVTAAGLAGVLLSSCALGPDFERPAAPQANFSSRPLPAETASVDGPGGAAQRFLPGESVAGDWWTLFQSPALNALVAEAIANNPSLEAAEASLRQAEATYQAEADSFFPYVQGDANFNRAQSYQGFQGPGATRSPYSVATAQVSVSYSPDIFGATRRTVEGFRARRDNVAFQKEAAFLALTSNVVLTAIEDASLSAQVAATEDILSAQNQQLGVLRQQLELGGIPEVQVLQQLTVVAQTRATLSPLLKAQSATRNRLLALVGRFPDQDKGEVIDLTRIALPRDLPISLPSELVTQRPDIRAAEASLHAASADIGVATANIFPRLTLNASYGSSAGSIQDLFSAGTGVWGLGAGLLQPIWRGGELFKRRRAVIAAYDVAAAQYRGTVLGAFQNVADVLRALELDASALAAQVEAEGAARENFDIARLQLETGDTSFLSFLDAQRTYQQARIALVQAQASRFSDTAALFVALGGGWESREQESADARTTQAE
jgi:NodT family efflux transporter outer membrane factor (OMF) lipoprotein